MSRYSNFSHTYLTLDETSTVADRVAAEATSSFSQEPFAVDQCNAIAKHINTIAKLKGRDFANEYTTLVGGTDGKRDTIVRVIKRTLKSAIEMAEFMPVEAENAVKILALLNQNPVDLRSGYTKESAEINRLLKAGAEPENAALIASSSVAALFERLAALQAEFEELLKRQATADTELPTGETKAVVASVVFRLDALLSFIEAKAVDYPEFEDGASRIETIINSVMTPARARLSRGKVEEEVVAS